MLSRIVAAPFVLGLAIVAYLIVTVSSDYALYLVPCVVGLVLIYMFSPQIDWIWQKRNPPELDEKMRLILNNHFDYYKNLSADEKKRFRDRMSLYMVANEFMPAPGLTNVARDVQGFIAASAVQMTFGRNDYRMPKFEHIIVYPKPFPSPQYPEHFHTSEIFEEDGVIMFATKQLMDGVLERGYYQIGLHEYANVFLNSYPTLNYPVLPDDIWEQLESISRFSKTYIHEYINIPEVNPMTVCIHHFFRFPENMRNKMPEIYNRFKEIFNQDPAQRHEPVIKRSEKLLELE